MEKTIGRMKRIIYIFAYFSLKLLSLFIRKNDNYLVFGSWRGTSYTDNTRYLFEYILSLRKGYKLIWIGKDYIENQLPTNNMVIFCRKNSLKSVYYILKSRYVFLCQGYSDIFPINIYYGVTKVFLGHGIAIKKYGIDGQGIHNEMLEESSWFAKMYRKIARSGLDYDYFVSSSSLNTECICSAYGYRGARCDNIIRSGQPRNDLLFSYTGNQALEMKEKYAKLIGFDLSKKIILYMPTFRRTTQKTESLCAGKNTNLDALVSIMEEHNALLIEKNHFVNYRQNEYRAEESNTESLIRLQESNLINVQEMLLFTDILITDYSSVYLDYVLLDRPIIHYVYDYEFYRDIDSGLYFDINDFAAGAITRTFKETCNEIERLLYDNDRYMDKRKYIRKKYLEYDKGDASQKIYEFIFNKNQIND